MKVEVTVCKHELATGKLDGMIYTVTVKGKKGFDTALDEALKKCGLAREALLWGRNIEDEDGVGSGYIWKTKEIDGIEHRFTLIGNTVLWDHSF
ncbi:MAG: hypothetical protein WCP12_04680 [bacterium]